MSSVSNANRASYNRPNVKVGGKRVNNPARNVKHVKIFSPFDITPVEVLPLDKKSIDKLAEALSWQNKLDLLLRLANGERISYLNPEGEPRFARIS